MSRPDAASKEPAAWHRLLAPLPAEAVPRRRPVAPPEITAKPEGAAIAGWENITLELSAGSGGLRALIVTLDARGQLLSASDHVLYSQPVGTDETLRRHESLGGRFEADGSFRGTHWTGTSRENADGETSEHEQHPRAPSEAETAALREIAAELIRRSLG